MKKIIVLAVIVVVALVFIFTKSGNKQMSNDKENKTSAADTVGAVSVTPVSHASMILNWDGMVIYTDPSVYKADNANMFAGKPAPDMILITDIHSDHLDVETLKKIATEKTIIVAPKAAADQIPKELNLKVSVMNNGEIADYLGFQIEAIPMYNILESGTSFHTKGRGNGYVIEKDGERIYISGDTSGIPEMRNLQNIDMAFVAMNLPYTMGVEEAADAILAFAPKKVYPYHYRTPEGFSDVAKFKEIVNSGNPKIEVVQLEWYPK